ncbi:MAG: hypothetical protein A2015_05095 [Spirochaetes bacterium GWF1_31_7]|nr:MAG: hypothetical protein A2Y30_06495 [Spirochaetes bacterium GWE1_32_154]OHD47220.1 MAG: hypothetical protein A2015_05095 [Spirochaetes bacterium GWF1_31_7]OHD52636.1 MAG: hypothetical protein A2Y29_09670 [Spirochaetes bacterium GWE2_31_10]OHD73249.1 MAG: hypothetical protein A2355_16900 [Spirochaetes bacterium RIFOXYB1_FULL_32_8]HBD94301.1 hypothetical protein [Spirochaetia bacterium]
MKSVIKYSVDSSCNLCGICEKICPSDTIKIKDNKVVWQKDANCYYCFACFNACPNQSILIDDRYTDKKGRYIHPGISIKDLISQK